VTACPVAASAKANADRVALRFGGREWTWRQADAEVSTVEAALSREGVRAGSIVRRHSFNAPELAWTFFASARLGAIFTPLNARLTPAELERLPAPQVSQSTGDDQILAALYTSGTTGVPRAVPLTRRNFDANARASAERLGASAADRWLGSLPLFHIGGLAMAWRCATSGAALELEPSFEVERMAGALARGITHASLVPTMLERVLDLMPQGPNDLRAVLIGGGPMSAATLRRARERGMPVLQTYGLTEACSQVTTERLSDADGTTAGPAILGVEVRISSPDAEGIGEIEVHGPTVSPSCGPWLATKDLGRLDARGRLTVFARRTDLIVTGGENVYPAEVEAVLREHPAVRDVAVGAVASPEWGQIVVAALVGEVNETELLAWARERLAGFKLPRRVVRVPELPRNATGKIDRQALRALLPLPRGGEGRGEG